jgi:general secretion pathway protein N
MRNIISIFHLVLGGLCLCLSGIIAAELTLTVSRVAASPNYAAVGAAAQAATPAPPVDADALVAEILDRPLFSPDRHPPAPPPAPEAEAKTPPELNGRLAGVMIRPNDREALFARDGEKPITVKEGDTIDGWTVSTIEADRVVLTSEFGEKVVQPTMGERGEGVAPKPPRPANRPAPVPQPQRVNTAGPPGGQPPVPPGAMAIRNGGRLPFQPPLPPQPATRNGRQGSHP